MSNNIDIPIWCQGDPYPDDWPQWLRDADIEWCRVEIEEGSKVVWHDGIWNDGHWHDGHWHNGRWRAGTWRYGVWHYGTWLDGVWYDGVWHGGVWHGGDWRGGTWHDGTWLHGLWLDGDWRGGSWYDGDWRGGSWYDGEAWCTDGPPDNSIQPEKHMSKTETDVIEYPHHGMDLRDRLAAHVIQGLLANPNGPIQSDGTSCTIEEVADLAWRIADHMLKARGGSKYGVAGTHTLPTGPSGYDLLTSMFGVTESGAAACGLTGSGTTERRGAPTGLRETEVSE